eukprot:TRINITY_DN4502_c0_g4_i1.p1 TRINITY_DN4502_c0_g4~~TRINITY_DN4502_c0_g4_i1.p1  ORF type:complete len:610 (-),score=178.09 TRINITY_DN4502_c0_g4_i1:395-2224(-)
MAWRQDGWTAAADAGWNTNGNGYANGAVGNGYSNGFSNGHSNGFSSNGYSGKGRSSGGGAAPVRGGGDWGKKLRQQEQSRLKDEKTQREVDYYWNCVESNKQWLAERGGMAPQKGARRLKEEELELFGTMSATVGIDFGKYDNIPVDLKGRDTDEIPRIEQFTDLWNIFQLPDFVWFNLERMGYKIPTPIQKFSIPTALAGRDAMCCAQTGSGKTFSFLFPILCLLEPASNPSDLSYNGVSAPHALVLSPTRELCSQTFLEARKLSFSSPFKTVEVYGGVEAKPQLKDLARGAQLIAATPGRLIDYVDRGVMTLRDIKFLVLDEADRMLDMGFEPQIREIVEKRDMPSESRQTLLFSATFPNEIQKLAKSFLWDYVWIGIGMVGAAAESVSQTFIETTDHEKPTKLVDILWNDKESTTLVFCAMKRTCAWLENHLKRSGFSCAAIHGDMEQREREASLGAFRGGRINILVATDVAARGLDIPAVSHVVNYDLPGNIDDYVHRIGRTGRIGRRGWATAFYVQQGKHANTNILRDLIKILKKANQEVPEFLLKEAGWGASGDRGKGGSFGGRDARGGNYGDRNRGGKGMRKGAKFNASGSGKASGKGGKRN